MIVGRLACAWRGHEFVRAVSNLPGQRRVYLRCICGAQSPGWYLDADPPPPVPWARLVTLLRRGRTLAGRVARLALGVGLTL